MKRFFSALALCTFLLLVLATWLIPSATAKEDPLILLLNLPAPPPPNPWLRTPVGSRPPEFYDKEAPPSDDAKIEDLMDFWSRQSSGFQELGYNPKPSDRALTRIIREIRKDPNRVSEFLNILQDDKQGTDLVRDVYRQMAAGGNEEERELRKQLKQWLSANTDEFVEDLVKSANQVRDTGDYVANQDALLRLSKVDWDRAAPIVNRLYNDGTQKVSKVLATWALYRNALLTGGSDVDRYRDELKAIVEDRSAGDGARDLALDALVKEKDWSGRDEWYYSLLADETLHDLRVNGQTYTGLTTIMYYTADDGHVGKMIELTASDNIVVRSAAVKNLVLRLNRMSDLERNKNVRVEIARALLPWFRDPKWVKEDPSGKLAVIRILSSVKLPEAVPALIAALDEKQSLNTTSGPDPSPVNTANGRPADAVAGALDRAANAASAAANAAAYTVIQSAYYAYRSQAISALERQADPRAVPALRRVLTQVEEYERASVVKALLACGGFTTEEQAAAIEFIARNAGDATTSDEQDTGEYDYSTPKGRAKQAIRTTVASQRIKPVREQEGEEGADSEFESYGENSTPDAPAETYTDSVTYTESPQKPITSDELSYTLGAQLVELEDPGDELVRAVVSRIDFHDKRDPITAEALRKILLAWNGVAVNALLLRDLKAGRADADEIVKLIAARKTIRQVQLADAADARNGVPSAQGIVPCLLEDGPAMEAVIDTGSDNAKAFLFACARLIRARLAVPRVALHLTSANTSLALASERYLESEDSPEARALVLRRYPDMAKILGATTAFEVEGTAVTAGKSLAEIFASVSPYYAADSYAASTFYYDASFRESEKRLQKDVLSDPELIGVYAYDRNFVHIYKDRAVYSWSDDPARYRERELETPEWESLKGFLAAFEVDKLPPFLACTDECDTGELLMLSKFGGRRVFLKSSGPKPEFFAGLEKMFEDMRLRPAKLKYYAAAAIPGLRVEFAADGLSAKSVWKDGGDIRVLVSNEDRAKAIELEISKRQDEEEGMLEVGEDNSEHYQKFYRLRESRKYESFGWFRLTETQITGPAPQPSASEYLPAKDGFAPAASWGNWKAKTPAVEIRADDTGLYKIAAGRVTRIRSGMYADPVVTSNGRWAVATKLNDEAGTNLVRVNLITNKESSISSGKYYPARALAYIGSVNRVLLTGYGEDDHNADSGEEEYNPSAYDSGRDYYFLDPETGIVSASIGEVRPLAQQTFRSLQPAGVPGEFWAALPRGTAGTLVGVYSSRTFSFRPIVKLPKLIFDSTEMWVDTGAARVWFAYRGHLLSAPLK